MYKIRNKITGLYSSGGSGYRLRWSKKGKIWAERGHISNHLALFRDPMKTYADCEIVEIEPTVKEIVSISDWCKGVTERREARNKAAKEQLEEFRKEQRRKQFMELSKEFGL